MPSPRSWMLTMPCRVCYFAMPPFNLSPFVSPVDVVSSSSAGFSSSSSAGFSSSSAGSSSSSAESVPSGSSAKKSTSKPEKAKPVKKNNSNIKWPYALAADTLRAIVAPGFQLDQLAAKMEEMIKITTRVLKDAKLPFRQLALANSLSKELAQYKQPLSAMQACIKAKATAEAFLANPSDPKFALPARPGDDASLDDLLARREFDAAVTPEVLQRALAKDGRSLTAMIENGEVSVLGIDTGLVYSGAVAAPRDLSTSLAFMAAQPGPTLTSVLKDLYVRNENCSGFFS